MATHKSGRLFTYIWKTAPPDRMQKLQILGLNQSNIWLLHWPNNCSLIDQTVNEYYVTFREITINCRFITNTWEHRFMNSGSTVYERHQMFMNDLYIVFMKCSHALHEYWVHEWCGFMNRTIAGCTLDHRLLNHLSLNFSVGISERCFIFDFAQLPLEVARSI